jgi:4-hydroxybenzoate polyprenyltransferase
MKKLRDYLSLVKFSHTIFAMPFAITGFFMGIFQLKASQPGFFPANENIVLAYFSSEYLKFIWVIACMVFARSAAMAFNRYLDREFDAKNPRTAIREIPKGIISPSSALRFTILNVILFMGAAFLINMTCFWLSPIALLVILGYSYTKRFTALCHLVLGLGLALAPTGAFIAVTETVNIAVVLLSLGVVTWVSGFDIIYSLQDEEFDSSMGLRSIPAALGRKNALLLSRMLHIASALFIFGADIQMDLGWAGTIGLGIFVGLLNYQHSLVKADDLSKVNIAFMTTNGIASLLYALFTVLDLFLKA